MTDMEDLKQLVAAAANATTSANTTDERSFRLADDNHHSILVLNQQMLSVQTEMLQVKRDIRDIQMDIRGLQQENRRILYVLLNQSNGGLEG